MEAMDETTRLVAELLNKLAECDQKVFDIRQGMAQEFQHFSHHLLHEIPEAVSARVQEVIAGELHNYPALSPALSSARRGRASPPPVLPHTSGVPRGEATLSSSLERERERGLHGLIVPSFLPLLDVKPSPVIAASVPITSPTEEPNLDTDSSPPHSQPSPPNTTPNRPQTVRRPTDETVCSGTSDDSVSRTRKSSLLRRSSRSSSKDGQSPRRVRFDIEGEEVLTTASPPISPQMTPRIGDILSSNPSDGGATSMGESISHIVYEGESNILGNSPPRPKKISSTERLRALAKISTEDTSKWAVVGNPQEDDEEEEGLLMLVSKKKSKSPLPISAVQNDMVGDAYDAHDTLDHQSSSQDVKSITPPREVLGVKSNENPNPSSRQPVPQVVESFLATLSPQSHDVQSHKGEAEESMFEFEDEHSASRPVTAKFMEIEEEEDEEEDEETTPLADNTDARSSISLFSTSPAIPIAKAASLPAASRDLGTSVGSYKGKPFIIGVVDEELHRKASEMGNVQSFVGSVDGRSGVDPSNSYHQDQNFLGWAPKTSVARLMEQSLARRKANKTDKTDHADHTSKTDQTDRRD